MKLCFKLLQRFYRLVESLLTSKFVCFFFFLIKLCWNRFTYLGLYTRCPYFGWYTGCSWIDEHSVARSTCTILNRKCLIIILSNIQQLKELLLLNYSNKIKTSKVVYCLSIRESLFEHVKDSSFFVGKLMLYEMLWNSFRKINFVY